MEKPADTTAALRERVAELPTLPGVYLFKDATGTIIYIGKAKSLRARVRNYFGEGGDGRFQIPWLVGEATAIDFFLTDNEKEALLLENNLIKQHQPRYNVELKDDKHYLCLRIDPKAAYPRVEIVRRLRQDGARYFGPYHSASAIRETVRLLNRHFQLRTCKDTVFKNRKRPCLQYEIKRCPGPCVFEVDRAAYAESVSDVMVFLEGREQELVRRLSERMLQAAEHEDFEIAATLRDQIRAVEQSLVKQRVMSADLEDRDVFGVARDGLRMVIQLLWVRDGKLRGGRAFDLDRAELADEEILADALRRYYDSVTEVPREVLLPMAIESEGAFAAWLREKRGGAVDVFVPERGNKRRLVLMAQNNASHRLQSRVETSEAAQKALERLQRALSLKNFPERIEAYDISNTQGGEIVGSQVVFEDGLPARAEYRHYKIKHGGGQDDFRAMHEMLTRRLRRGLEEGELPSLIVIDGGIGQLNVARAVFNALGIEGVDLCSLAKSRLLDDDQGFQGETSLAEPSSLEPSPPIVAPPTVASPKLAPPEVAPTTSSPPRPRGADAMKRSPERVFLPGQKNPIVLKPHAAELLLLTHLRDEAHRFAITFHRKLRKKRSLKSALDDVKGLGPKRRRAILRHFGSVKAFAAATPAELAEIPGVPATVAVEAQALLGADAAAEKAVDKRRGWKDFLP